MNARHFDIHEHATSALQPCDNALLPDEEVCASEGCPAAGAGPSEPTQTLQPPKPLPLHFASNELPELESITEETEQPDVLLSQQIGEYVVRRYVGSGGMGVVYEGEHVTIGCKVAIKLIRDELTRSPHARGLLSEARAASAIRHRGIIDIFGFGQQPGLGQYLVMEYLEGRPLDQVIKERGPLPLTKALPLLCEVLDALSAAHAAGVIHRDLKPSNIFVVRQTNGTEYVKVLDFGLAKRTDVPNGTTPQTHSNLIVGTPQYMAPEQILGEEVGPRTDLYAVGAIAFELLTGQRPFSSRSHMEAMVHHLKSPPPVPSSRVALPPEIDELILRLLAKEPRLRPASASDVAQELRALLQPSEETLSGRLTRTVPVISPPAEAADAEVPTATLVPPAAAPTISTAGARRSWARLAFWKWSVVMAGCLTFALGGGWALGRGCTEPIAAAPVSAQAEGVAAPTLQPSQLQALTSSPQPLYYPQVRVMFFPTEAAKGSMPVIRRPRTMSPSAQLDSSLVLEPNGPLEPTMVPAPTGLLHLQVKDFWADVWLDGRIVGTAPLQGRYILTAGEHELKLHNPCCKPYQKKIIIKPDETLIHTAELSPEHHATPTPP